MILRRFSMVILAGALLPLIFLSACDDKKKSAQAQNAAGQSEKISLTGELFYRQRIALPPESTVIMTLKDGNNGTLLSEQQIDLHGKQVPIPFQLAVPIKQLKPDAPYLLTAAIVSNGKMIWVSEPKIIEPKDTKANLGSLMMTQPQQDLSPTVFQCGPDKVVFTLSGMTSELRFKDKRYSLTSVIAASGAKYQAVNDPGTVFWSKGDKAFVTLNGKDLPECQAMKDEPNVSDIEQLTWRLKSIDGKAPVAHSNITLHFDGKGHLNGQAGCNQYSGQYVTENETLMINPSITSTLAACIAEPVMTQEAEYLKILGAGKVLRKATGELVITSPEGKTLVYQQ